MDRSIPAPLRRTRDSGAGPGKPSRDATGDDAALAEVDALASFLDARYRIPGTPIRFGVDAVLGLVPGLGDLAAMGPALYLIWRARSLGAPNHLLLRMLGNVGVDTLVGSIPLAGSVFDVFFKGNRRNYRLLRRHLAQRDPSST